MDRKQRLLDLADNYGIDPEIVPANYSGEEDLALILEEAEYLDFEEAFAAVTAAGEYNYVKVYDDFGAAKRGATENLWDSIYSEGPVEIVNLDTGARFTPRVEWDAR